MHFVMFHPEVASCLLSRVKRKYAPLGMRLLWKYIRNYFLVYQLISHFLLYLKNYKEFEAEILDLQSEKYGLSFDIKKYTTSGWALGDENVIGIRAFKIDRSDENVVKCELKHDLFRKRIIKVIGLDIPVKHYTFWKGNPSSFTLTFCVVCVNLTTSFPLNYTPFYLCTYGNCYLREYQLPTHSQCILS